MRPRAATTRARWRGRAMVEPINAFFEQVMVMAEDPAVRGNRLKLLADVVSTLRLVGDFEQLPG